MEHSKSNKSNSSVLLAKKNVVVVRTGKGFYTEIMANRHPIVADEPFVYGGTDRGPSPYDLLSASLGS